MAPKAHILEDFGSLQAFGLTQSDTVGDQGVVLFERIRRCGLVAGSMPLEMGLKVVKAHARPSVTLFSDQGIVLSYFPAPCWPAAMFPTMMMIMNLAPETVLNSCFCKSCLGHGVSLRSNRTVTKTQEVTAIDTS